LTVNLADRPCDLGLTYHVGEDFYDIVDGLRAIDEVLIFMNFTNGNRLGHALVLGTEVEQYYKNRDYCIRADKQTLLDNVVWLYIEVIRTEGFVPLCAYLKEQFIRYFDEVYGKEKSLKGAYHDINVYYLSCLLRGDAPETSHKKKEVYPLENWDKYAKCHHPKAVEARKNETAKELYRLYHFSKDVKVRGGEGETWDIRKDMRVPFMKAVCQAQQRMLSKIERLGVGIECNPTSNFKIGEMTRYDQHPIYQFYNEGIDTPYTERGIAVSINTDDKGIFSTSLEREYSLIALAMEKNEYMGVHNTKRAVINWLDRVRQMGVEQRFEKMYNLDFDKGTELLHARNQEENL
jgi:hypothetical protein